MKKFIVPALLAAVLVVAFAVSKHKTSTVTEKDPHASKHHYGEFAMDLFHKMDGNSDGVITQEELSAHHKKIFDEVDTNKDGKITKEEAKVAKREHSFNKINDKTKKGFVTFAETFAEEEAYFANADADKDSKVTEEEFRKHYLASFEK